MTAALETVLLSKSALEWEALLSHAGVPAAKVLSIPEVVAHPQVATRGFVYEFASVPGLDRALAVPTAGFKVDGGPLTPSSPPPRLGEHTDEVLRSIGVTDDELHAFRETRKI